MSDLARAPILSARRSGPAMLACNVVIVVAVLIYKICKHDPQLEYARLLATYQFGVIRRAVVGQARSRFRALVPATDVLVLGLSLILITIAVFVFASTSIFGFSREKLPLFSYMAGSPFLFNKFIFRIGQFDVLGCLSA